jgi:hypothetical protein
MPSDGINYMKMVLFNKERLRFDHILNEIPFYRFFAINLDGMKSPFYRFFAMYPDGTNTKDFKAPTSA